MNRAGAEARAMMPHHLSLTQRLAQLRSRYTGETHAAALSAVTLGVQRLDQIDRIGLVAALRGDPTAVPERSRQLVLADATHIEQQEVEAAIVLAASRLVHLRPPNGSRQLARVFRGVRPALSHLVLHVDAAAVLPLLRELLPRHIETGITGVPGLRVWPHRRHLTLIQLDTPVQVHLVGVTPAQWKHAHAVLADTPGFVSPDARRLTGVEREAISCWSQAINPVPVLSALLRRICLFEHQPWVIPTGKEGQVCYLGWPLHRTEPPVTGWLLHPITGIPAMLSEPGWTSDRHTVIPVNASAGGVSRTVLVLPAQLDTAHPMSADQLAAS